VVAGSLLSAWRGFIPAGVPLRGLKCCLPRHSDYKPSHAQLSSFKKPAWPWKKDGRRCLSAINNAMLSPWGRNKGVLLIELSMRWCVKWRALVFRCKIKGAVIPYVISSCFLTAWFRVSELFVRYEAMRCGCGLDSGDNTRFFTTWNFLGTHKVSVLWTRKIV